MTEDFDLPKTSLGEEREVLGRRSLELVSYNPDPNQILDPRETSPRTMRLSRLQPSTRTLRFPGPPRNS